MKMYNIRLDEDIINRFKKRAELNDMSQAELFNEMIDVYENKKNEKETIEERIRCLESEMNKLQALMTFNYEYTTLLVNIPAPSLQEARDT